MKNQNIDEFYDKEKTELKKVSEIRKIVIPMFETAFQKTLEEIKPKEQHIHLPENVVGKHSIVVDLVNEEFKKVFSGEFGKLCEQVAKLDKPEKEVQKVEVTNQTVAKEVKIEQKDVKFPEVQKVKDNLTHVKIEKLEKAVNTLIEITVNKKFPEFPYKEGEILPVAIKDMPIAVNGGGKGEPEKIWLKEEFTYTTISGARVPTIVKKWDDDKRVTETYTYESIVVGTETIVSPISKTREIIQHEGVGV